MDTARSYGWLLAAGYGLAFLYGLFAAGNSDINFLSLNGADNGLHLVSAVAGVAIALLPAERTVPVRAVSTIAASEPESSVRSCSGHGQAGPEAALHPRRRRHLLVDAFTART